MRENDIIEGVVRLINEAIDSSKKRKNENDKAAKEGDWNTVIDIIGEHQTRVLQIAREIVNLVEGDK